MTNSISTDRKLLVLLGGQRTFLSRIDPEGLLSGGYLSQVAINMDSSLWSMKLRFPSGEKVILNGRFKESLNPVADVVKMPLSEGGLEDFRLKASETLCGGLGPLNEVPAWLRRILSPGVPKTAHRGELSIENYLDVINNALVWGIELQNEDNPLEDFSRYNISFTGGDGTNAEKIQFRISNSLLDGEIFLESDATLFGLGSKKVILRKNLGMMRMASINCTTNKKGRQIPSLKAAFDLYDAIPILYEKERKENISIGKPKAR